MKETNKPKRAKPGSLPRLVGQLREIIREAREEADRISDDARDCKDTASKWKRTGLSHARREMAMRIEAVLPNEKLSV